MFSIVAILETIFHELLFDYRWPVTLYYLRQITEEVLSTRGFCLLESYRVGFP